MSILEEINQDIDWKTEMHLIDDRILDSFDVLTTIADLEDAFDIEIRADEITRENFNSVEAIWNMVCRMKEE